MSSLAGNDALLARAKEKKQKKAKKEKKKKKSSKKEELTIRKSSTGTTVGSYMIGSLLGKGGFGDVYSGLCQETGHTVAIKQVYIKHVPKDELVSIKMEIELLKKLSHDNIVRYVGSLEQDGTLNIVLEFVESGSLSDLITKMGQPFKEPLVLNYMVQILEGLAYLHRQGVIHRDIKGANILTTKSGIVKLADFGVAINFDETASEGECVVGTPYWMAPEIIKMEGVTAKCDIWSVGCVIIELLTSRPPYFELAPMAALFRIVQDVHGPPLPNGISRVLKNFLGACFASSAEARKSAEELLQHPWIASCERRRKSQDQEKEKERERKRRREKERKEEREKEQERARTAAATAAAATSAAVKEAAAAAAAAATTSQNASSRGFLTNHQNVTKRRGGGGEDDEDEEDWDAGFGDEEESKGLELPSPAAPSAPSAPGLTLALPPAADAFDDDDMAGFDDDDDDDDFGSSGGGGNGGLVLSLSGGGDDDDDDGMLDWGDDDDNELDVAGGSSSPDQQSVVVARLKREAALRNKPSSSSSLSSSAADRLAMLSKFTEDDDDLDGLDMESFGSSPNLRLAINNNNNNEDESDFADGFGSIALGSSSPNGLGDDDDFDLEGVTDFSSALLSQHNRGEGRSGGGNGHGMLEEEEDVMGGFDMDDDDDDMAGFGDDDEDGLLGGGLDFDNEANFESDSQAEVEGIQIDETYRWLIAIRETKEEDGHERREAYRAVCGLLEAIATCPMTAVPRRASGSTLTVGSGQRNTSSSDTLLPSPSHHNVRLEQLKVLLGLAKGQDVMLREQLGLVPSESSLGPMYVLEMMNITHLPTRIQVLELVSIMIETDSVVLQTFVLVGMIPDLVRMSLSSTINNYSVEMKEKTSKIAHQVCKSKVNDGNSMRMFIASGGHTMLVDLLRIPYAPPTIPTTPTTPTTPTSTTTTTPRSTSSSSFSSFTARNSMDGDDRDEDDDEEEEEDEFIAFVVHTLPPTPSDPRPVIRRAIDTIRLVLDVKASGVNVHKNEMCRKFSQADILPALTQSMLDMCRVAGEIPKEWTYVQHLANLLHTFCYHGDIKVKANVVESIVMRNVLAIINLGNNQGGPLQQQNMKVLISQLVKCISHLSMVMSPSVIEALQRENVIPMLVSFLPDSPITTSDRLQNTVMIAIYHLCRLSPSRQEQAAAAGIVPRLLHLFGTAMKQMSLEVFCNLARASDLCRQRLSENGGVDVYLMYMEDRNWARQCLTSLASWLSKDMDAHESAAAKKAAAKQDAKKDASSLSVVEQELLREGALARMITLFQRERTESSEFEAILKPMLDIVSKSARINKALGKSSLFVGEISKRLQHPNNVVRMNLLKMLKFIMDHHDDLKILMETFQLYSQISDLAKDGEMAAVSFLANQILDMANSAGCGGAAEEETKEINA